MSKKTKLVVVIFGILISLVSFSCIYKSVSEINFTFPLRNADIEEVIENQKNSLSLLSDDLISEWEHRHVISDAEGIPFADITSDCNNSGRQLVLTGHFSNEQQPVIEKKHWKESFNLMSGLYGNQSSSSKVYKEFNEFISNTENKEVMYWRSRIDDIHVRISFMFGSENNNDMFIRNIQFMDSISYEAHLSQLSNSWEEHLSHAKLQSVGLLTVSQLNEIEYLDNVGGVIEGKIENIRVPTKEEKKSIFYINHLMSSEEVLMIGELVDSTGSSTIIVRSSSLISEEYDDLRLHHLYIPTHSNYPIINFSSKM